MAIEKTARGADHPADTVQDGSAVRFTSKKFLTIALLAAIAVFGVLIIGGLCADDSDADTTYKISGMSDTGYTLTAGEGLDPDAVPSGTNFTFTLEIAAGFGGTPVVKVNNTTLTASEGVYTIANVTSNKTITVTGLSYTIDYTDYALDYTIKTNDSTTKEVLVSAANSFPTVGDTDRKSVV